MPQAAQQPLLASRYRVLEKLGRGGMATVFLAEDERLGRRVAIKRLHADSPEDTAKRFAREARLGAALNHPNLVTIYDTVTDGEAVLIVMEYVAGETLADAIKRGPVEPERAVDIVCQLGAALDHAHEHGIVHRDIKPANILLGPNGQAKLVDLGIATALEGTRITRADSVVGTAAYMAPEQLDGRDAGPQADVYSLAVVAYEALSGKRAYRGSTPVEIAHQVVEGPPPDLTQTMRSAPPAAAAALRRAMSFDPADRPATGTEFADELASALRSGAVEPAAAPAPRRRTEREPEPEPPRRRAAAPPPSDLPPGYHRAGSAEPRRVRAAALAAMAALLVIAGIAAFLLLSSGDNDPSGARELSAADKKAQDARKTARRKTRQQQEAQQNQAAAPEEQQTTPQQTDGDEATPAERAQPSGGSYAVPQPTGTDPGRGAELQQQGHSLIQQGSYDEAIPVLEDAVKQFPAGTDDLNYAYSLFDLGNALRLAGRPQDAIPVLEERLKIDNQREVVQKELDAAKADAAGED